MVATRILPYVVLATAAIILLCQLVLPPPAVLADNADFGKQLGRFALSTGQIFEFANTQYRFDQRYYYDSGFSSSELLLIYPAVTLKRLILPNGSFDLRIIGTIHSALFLAALWLFVPLLDSLRLLARVLLCAVCLLIFCDAMYATYLNSFYMDVTTYLFFLLSVVLYLRVLRWRRPSEAAWLAICAAVMTASKPQYALMGVWFAILFWIGRDALWSGRKAVPAAVSLALLLVVWGTFRFGAPQGYTAKASFNVVFLQILPHSRDVGRDLAELHLDDSYRKWIGTHAYSPNSRLEDPTFFVPYLQRVPYSRIGWFYLRHPADAWLALRTSLDEAGRHRPALGNFDRHSGRPPWTETHAFSLWSDGKRRVYHHHPIALLCSFFALAALVLGLLVSARRTLPSGSITAGIVLAGMAAANLVLSALGDVLDPVRHQLIFFAQFDVLLVTALWLIARRLSFRRPAAVHKVGIAQPSSIPVRPV
jgi:hypothetical protein